MNIQIDDSKDWLSHSWNRSSEAGLRPNGLPEDIRLAKSQLSERRAHSSLLIECLESYALPLFNQMFARSNSRLILTDTQGVIIGSWGQERFQDKLTSIALESGVCWQEKLKGTNAIGTALVEAKPVSVIGDQHFISRHRFISCSASPIFDHHGNMLGVLDITSEQEVHQASTRLLVQSMVQGIENRLLTAIPDGKLRVDIACDKALLDSGWQGIVIADDSGSVIAHNQVASQLLNQPSIIGTPIDDLLKQESSRFVYRLHSEQKNPVRKRQTYSPSCELHHGDDNIESVWQQACRVIDKRISMMIMGETGVGKGEFVKALHRQSGRKEAPLVVVNCGALPKDLIESELFGYAPGAFTGASHKGYEGKIRQADRGILFLDEIADMPLEAQCRLLHVLQEKEVVPIGSNKSYKVDIQIISATHKDLEKQVCDGVFRQDLYYRLNGLVFRLPALRERKDKTELIKGIHRKYAECDQVIAPELLSLMENYNWPGNIRELDNLLQVASLLADKEPQLSLSRLPEHIASALVSSQPDQETALQGRTSLKETVDDTLIRAYHANNGNISRTSRVLNISRNTLYRKLKKLGMIPD